METHLPPEIVDIIYRTKHALALSDVHRELFKKEYIINNNYYIITRTGNHRTASQIVKIDGFRRNDGRSQVLYQYYYGVMGYHEGYSIRSNIRHLTAEEHRLHSDGQFWKLPQQFYQSTPTF